MEFEENRIHVVRLGRRVGESNRKQYVINYSQGKNS